MHTVCIGLDVIEPVSTTVSCTCRKEEEEEERRWTEESIPKRSDL